jgi:hypothetical protein
MRYHNGNFVGIAVGTLFRTLKGWFGLAILMTLTGYSNAQTGPIDASVPVSSSEQSNSEQSTSDGGLMPLPPNLETDLPLQVVVSPFHIGRWSLLSLSAYQGYDTNPYQQQVANGTEFSAFSGLVVYSIRGAEWNIDLQYEPSFFVSPQLTAKNWTGNATDAQVEHRLSPTWSFTAGEHFRYSPNVQSSIQGNGLSVSVGGGVPSVLTPFITSSRSLLLSTITGSLNHRFSEHSTLTLHAEDSFVRLSGTVTQPKLFGLIQLPPTPIPVEDSESASSGLGYNRVLGLRDSIEATYEYRAQFSSTTQQGIGSFHTASFGWSHEIAPSLRFSVSAGPGWSNPGTSHASWRTTVQGSVQLSKETRNGGISVSFSRSDEFLGVIGNNFNNHYALRIDRKFGTRLSLTTTGSYIQQQFYGGHNLSGEMGSFELAWFTTRNWSVFGQIRYLDTNGSELTIAPQKVVTAGVRWSWVPEKP